MYKFTRMPTRTATDSTIRRRKCLNKTSFAHNYGYASMIAHRQYRFVILFVQMMSGCLLFCNKSNVKYLANSSSLSLDNSYYTQPILLKMGTISTKCIFQTRRRFNHPLSLPETFCYYHCSSVF